MTVLKVALLATLVLTTAPAVTAADFGVRAGRASDSGEEFLGADVLFDLGTIQFNPNVEYLMSDDDVTAGSANLDVLFGIAHGSKVNPFIGAGLGLAYVDDDLGNNQTDLVGNLIGGVAFPLDFITPYAQVKYVRLLEEDSEGAAGDDVAFIIGLRF